ncbi:MAG: radical SAM protein [Polyangiaceae bacterium]|jgi:hypothetical protein|nr:radical SAM protein [Polyangiaceae bacterium]
MQLLLVHAPMLHITQLERLPTSTHLHIIYSYLRGRGVCVDVYDPIADIGVPGPDTAAYLRQIQLALKGRKFDIAGVSAWTSFQYLGSLAVGRLLRELNSDAILAVGGYHPSLVPSDYLPPQSDGPFDYIVRGAGERFLLGLCESPRRPNQPEVVQGKAAPLDDVRLDWSYPYHQAGVFLSRGCPFACTYCSHRTADHESMSVERAVQECLAADAASRDGLFRIQDAIFGLDRTWRRQFLEALGRHRLRARPCLEVRADQLAPDDAALLAPLRPVVYIGIDAGSPNTLRLMNKTRAPEQYLRRFLEVLEACDAHAVDYVPGVLLNHPGETADTLRESVDFFWRLAWDGPSRHMLGLLPHMYAYLPGSPIDELCASLARSCGARIHHPGWWRQTCHDQRALSESNTASTSLTPSHLEEQLNRLHIANFLLGPRRSALVEYFQGRVAARQGADALGADSN